MWKCAVCRHPVREGDTAKAKFIVHKRCVGKPIKTFVERFKKRGKK